MATAAGAPGRRQEDASPSLPMVLRRGFAGNPLGPPTALTPHTPGRPWVPRAGPLDRCRHDPAPTSHR